MVDRMDGLELGAGDIHFSQQKVAKLAKVRRQIRSN